MSESKVAEENACLASFPQVDILGVDVSPNPGQLTDELHLEVDFRLSEPLEHVCWDIKYLVDSVRKRHIIDLGCTEWKDYNEGESHFQFSVEAIGVAHIKQSNLTNCGLLIATLINRDRQEIMDLKMVVQVTKKGDQLIRQIFNPLE